jgi:hypothetical protein
MKYTDVRMYYIVCLIRYMLSIKYVYSVNGLLLCIVGFIQHKSITLHWWYVTVLSKCIRVHVCTIRVCISLLKYGRVIVITPGNVCDLYVRYHFRLVLSCTYCL